jgi:hypothetical protein
MLCRGWIGAVVTRLTSLFVVKSCWKTLEAVPEVAHFFNV